MKTLAWIAFGLLIGITAWIPLNMASRYDIPFGEAVLAFVGTVIGGVIVIVALVRWVRQGSTGRGDRGTN